MAFGRGKSNHTLARCAFFYQHCFTRSYKHNVVMKVRINTIGKKVHTLVKVNTPSCHEIRQECGFTEKVAFFYISLCFLPRCCSNIGREVRLMLPDTYQEILIYDTHTCLNFSKTCRNVCLYQTYQKAGVTLLHFWGSMCSKKRLAGRSFFQNSGLQGPGRVSPGGSWRAAPSSRFFVFF